MCFLWRTEANYPLIIIRYWPYLFLCQSLSLAFVSIPHRLWKLRKVAVPVCNIDDWDVKPQRIQDPIHFSTGA